MDRRSGDSREARRVSDVVKTWPTYMQRATSKAKSTNINQRQAPVERSKRKD